MKGYKINTSHNNFLFKKLSGILLKKNKTDPQAQDVPEET